MKLVELVSDTDLIQGAANLIDVARKDKLGQGGLCPKIDSKFPLFLAMLEGMHPAAAAGARIALLAVDEGLAKKFGIEPELKPPEASQ